MVVVDRLSKKKKFVALDSLEVEAVVQAFIEWIWREEGYPERVVSDRDSQFTSHFWKRMCERIGTKPKMSTAWHPETDSQTESANTALKQYLRAYVNYEQNDWVDFLPVAEFEANSDKNTLTGMAPFIATKGYLPKSGLEAPTRITVTGDAKRESLKADRLMERIGKLREFLKKMNWRGLERNRWSRPIVTGMLPLNSEWGTW
jgi:hypothetical protein